MDTKCRLGLDHTDNINDAAELRADWLAARDVTVTSSAARSINTVVLLHAAATRINEAITYANDDVSFIIIIT